MILCFAIFFLGHIATANDSSLCDYSCTPGGGCVVAYVGPSRFPFHNCYGFDGDDKYIMMQCLCVCLSQKIITSHFQAERRRREVSGPLGLLAVGRLWPSDNDDEDDDDNNWQE